MAVKETVDLWKSIFDLARAFVLTAFIVMFFAAPGLINRGLSGLGITEFDLWGLKGKTSLVEVAEAAKEQQLELASVKQQLQKTTDILNAVTKERDDLKTRVANGTSASPSASAATISSVVSANEAALSSAANSASQVAQVLRANASTIAAAQSAVSDSSAGWLVLFGSDATEADARHETDRAKSLNVATRIYYNGNRYRSAVWFSQLQDARGILPQIQQLSATASESYIVSLATWCPHPSQRPNSTVVECHSS
jgi:hypothetical protein